MRKYNDKSNSTGALIRKIREEKHVSQEELCRQLQLRGINIDRFHLYRMETQSVIIKDFELIAICQILKIDSKMLNSTLDI